MKPLLYCRPYQKDGKCLMCLRLTEQCTCLDSQQWYATILERNGRSDAVSMAADIFHPRGNNMSMNVLQVMGRGPLSVHLGTDENPTMVRTSSDDPERTAMFAHTPTMKDFLLSFESSMRGMTPGSPEQYARLHDELLPWAVKILTGIKEGMR